MVVALVVAMVALLVFAWLSWRMSRLHRKLAELYQLVADMLENPSRAEELAREVGRRHGFID